MHNSRCPKRCEESLFHPVMVIQNVGDLEGSKVGKERLPQDSKHVPSLKAPWMPTSPL